jgi:hypothetical protein
MTNSIRATIALLEDETLIWSDDFETIRRPLADLLRKIAQSPTHQFDDEIDELAFALEGAEIPLPRIDPMQAWINEAARQLGVEQASKESRRNVFKRMFWRG